MYIDQRITNKFGSPVGSISSNNELRFYCPFCEREKGSPDKVGHLYVNAKSLFYICHRCVS